MQLQHHNIPYHAPERLCHKPQNERRSSIFLKSLTASGPVFQPIIAFLIAWAGLILTPAPLFSHPFSNSYIQGSSSSSGSFGYDGGSARAAFAAIEARQTQDALRILPALSNALLADVLTGLIMEQDDSPYDFNAASQFLQNHTYWPESDRKAIARQAEKKMDGTIDPQTLLAFFNVYPPQTGDGFMRYIDVLSETRQQHKIAKAVRDHWREDSLGEDEQRIFLDRFGRSLSGSDTFYRLDRALWEKQYEQAERLYPLLSPGVRALAQARIALAKGNSNAPKLVDRVPANLQNDNGLLYERTRWRRKKDDMAGAYTLIRQVGNRMGAHADEWWDERNVVIRDLLSTNTYAQAYQLAAAHGLTQGSDYTDAEFLAGWIALRFLNNPTAALAHFQNISRNATTPITAARGAYWLGRAYEALGQGEAAQRWYTKGAGQGTTYYGQLAAARLYPSSEISALAPAIAQDAVANFQNQLMPQIVTALAEAGAKKTAERFALSFANAATRESDFRLMAGLALQLNLPDVAVKVSKAAAKKQILMPVEGYPLIGSMDSTITALAHAITRQESQFDARAISTSNAQGLMQLLPSTAKHVSTKWNIPADTDNLCDPETNVRLGCAYLQELLGNFNGSLPLTIGAYNAGPGRMREWLGKIGDPRGQSVEAAVDWVERIPFNETRNYVQRVLEALQVYRAKLAGGAAILGINNDLTN